MEQSFAYVVDFDNEGLMNLLRINADCPIQQLVDGRGYTLLHEAAFQDCEQIMKSLVKLAKDTMTTQQMHDWINHKTNDDGFAALHFTSFKGNPDMSELLITLSLIHI